MLTFFVLWSGQFVSTLGSALTTFALGVWVYGHTDSIVQLSVVYIVRFVPGMLATPFTAPLIDRFNRRTILLIGITGQLLCALTLTGLSDLSMIAPAHIYAITIVNSVLATLTAPAYSASVSTLVPPRQLGRANGMVMLAQAIAQIAGPLGGAFLLELMRIGTLTMIDAGSFVVALACLLVIRIPVPPRSVAGTAGRHSLLGETLSSWRHIAARHGLVGLLAFYAALNLAIGIVNVLLIPFVLTFASTEALGTVTAIGGAGMVTGSLAVSIWGGPRRRVRGVLGFGAVMGLALCTGTLQANLLLFGCAAFVLLFCAPIINASARSIWQTKIEPDLQGRVFSLENTLAGATLPIAYLLVNPLLEHVATPLLAAGGALHGMAPSLGTGQGPAMALLLFGAGLIIVLAAGVGFLYPRLRLVEVELPDTTATDTGDSSIGAVVPA